MSLSQFQLSCLTCMDQANRWLGGRRSVTHTLSRFLLVVLLSVGSFLCFTFPATAALNNDRYDGEIFALYAGNGSLVPPKVSLEASLQRHYPALLLLYADDSRDCKQYAVVVSQLQGVYGRVTNFIAVRADSIPVKSTYAPTEPGYYYHGVVPQTVVFDTHGKVVLNASGARSFESVDDVFRQMFELLPRSESAELKRRPLNEINTELVK